MVGLFIEVDLEVSRLSFCSVLVLRKELGGRGSLDRGKLNRSILLFSFKASRS